MEAQRYYFRNYGIEDGLSQSNGWSVFQDRDGYMWIGTEAGLNRFDGNRFETFSIRQGLRSDSVEDTAQSADGTLWFATNSGVSSWDGREFINYSLSSDTDDSLVNCVAVGPSGGIWCGTQNGLAHLKGSEFQLVPAGNTFPQSVVEDLYVDRFKRLWISTRTGLYYLEKGSYKQFRAKSLQGQSIKSVTHDSNGNLWVATYTGVYQFKGSEQTASFTSVAGEPFSRILTMNALSDGSVWIGTPQHLCRIQDGKLYKIMSSNGLDFNYVTNIFEDREGIIWVGYGGGVAKFLGPAFTNYTISDGLGSAFIRSIIRDKHGTLWAATNRGLSRFDGSGWQEAVTSGGSRFKPVFFLFRDSRDILWVCAIGGLWYYDGEQFHEEKFFSESFVNSMGEDKNGQLWFAVSKKGIFRKGPDGYRQIKGPWKKFLRATVLKDSKGNMWVSSFGGLYRWDGRSWKRFSVSDGLSGSYPYFMCEDRKGNLWFGYHSSHGLTSYDGTRFRTYTVADGLSNDAVFSLGVDRQDNLWVGTARGVDKFDGKTFTNYSTGDGYVHNESNAGGFFADKDGTLWFGTAGGISHYDPSKDIFSTAPPVIKIRSLVFGEKSIPVSSSPELPYYRNDIKAEVACLTYFNRKRLDLRFKLNGYDMHWKPLKGYEITFTNLPSGNYRLEVQGRRAGGSWSESAAANFTIRPPFWQTWWFYSLFAFFLFVVGRGIYRIRIKNLKQREIQLQQLVDERTRLLRKANQAARDGRRAAELANQSKSIFLARMSHEIRTPMNGILGFSDMLLDTPLSQEQKEYAGTIQQSSEALIHILNDILDFSKMEAGEIHFDSIDFDPEMIAFDVCDIIAPRLSGKPVEVLCRIGDNVPRRLRSDPGRFRQVVLNLMSNAAKFTEEGEIELSLEVREEKNDRLMLSVEVRDTGIGIPKDKVDTIFDTFKQADGSISRKFGGTGLGLAISKEISQLMGGNIRVESEIRTGTTFYFSAWMEKVSQIPEDTVINSELAGKTVLVVDHNQHTLDILTHTLERVKMRVVPFIRPRNVIKVIRDSFDSAFPPDLCIIDTNIPGVNGYDIARQIRDLKSPVSTLPLLAFSTASPYHSRMYRGSGFNGFLTKPVRRQKLFMMIEHLLGYSGTSAQNIQENPEPGSIIQPTSMQSSISVPSVPDDAKRSIRILLVEDNPINRKLARFMLTRGGYGFEVVENGQEAVDTYTMAPEQFDLILMDIRMPEMDGREATRRIRKHGFSDIPIIAMTAESMKGDREKCLEAGMNDYISKPIKRETVYKMVKKWCGDTV